MRNNFFFCSECKWSNSISNIILLSTGQEPTRQSYMCFMPGCTTQKAIKKQLIIVYRVHVFTTTVHKCLLEHKTLSKCVVKPSLKYFLVFSKCLRIRISLKDHSWNAQMLWPKVLVGTKYSICFVSDCANLCYCRMPTCAKKL